MKKEWLTEKEEEIFGSCFAGRGANHLPWERKDLTGGTIQINYKMNFIQDSCQRFSLHFESTFHRLLQAYCITHKKCIFIKNQLFLGSLFSVMRHNSSGKELIKVQMFILTTARTKINQIPCVIFPTTSQFFFKYCISLQCHDTCFLCNFLAQTLYTWIKRSPLKCKF